MRHVCGSCRSPYTVKPGHERIVQAYSKCEHCERAAAEYRRADCARICRAWNEATNPSKLRSEEEHAKCREEARALKFELELFYVYGTDYTESESSGRLLPVLLD